MHVPQISGDTALCARTCCYRTNGPFCMPPVLLRKVYLFKGKP